LLCDESRDRYGIYVLSAMAPLRFYGRRGKTIVAGGVV
jgi:hypothetical protein